MRSRFFSSLWPTTAYERVDFLANIAFYAPLGLLLAVNGRAPREIWAAAAVLSTTAELLQYAIPGRDPSAADIVANTLGAALAGALVLTPIGGIVRMVLHAANRLVRLLVDAPTRAAGILSLAWGCIVTAVLIGSAWLLSPAPPRTDRYFVRSPQLDHAPGPLRIGAGDDADFFGGVIDEVRIYRRALPDEAIRADAERPVGADQPQQPDLVAAYAFDEGTGTVLHDRSGRGHDGAINGARWTARGRFGSALSFDGRSNQAVIPSADDLDLRTAFTLEAWVFPVGRPREWPAIVSYDSYYLYGSTDTGPYIAAGGGLFGWSNVRVRVTMPIRARQWTHLASTYDGQVLRIYVNGVLANTTRWWAPHQPATAMMARTPLTDGAVVDQQAIRELLLRDNVSLRLSVTCGERSPAAAPVFFLWAPGNLNVLTLLAEGDDLLIRSATQASRLGFTSPDYRVSGAFADCDPGREREVSLTGRLQDAHAAIDGHTVRAAGLGPASAWAFFIHSELLPAWVKDACALAWLGALVFPCGFWLRGTVAGIAGAAVSALAFVLVPRLSHIEPLDTGQIAVLLLAVGAGWSYQLLRRRAVCPVR